MSVPDAAAPDAAVPEASPWRPVGPWDGLLQAGRLGDPDGPPGLVAAPAQPASAALITVAPAGVEALAAALRARIGASPPLTPRLVRGEGAAVRWAGPGQWLGTSGDAGFALRLAAALAGVAEVADQGSARAALLLSGPRVRDVLAKGVVLDLDPRVFGPGAVALTTMAHMTVHLVRVDEGQGEPAYEVSVGRSFAGSLWRWLVRSAEAYGLLVVADKRDRGDFACPSRPLAEGFPAEAKRTPDGAGATRATPSKHKGTGDNQC